MGFGDPRCLQETDREALESTLSSRETLAVEVLSSSRRAAPAVRLTSLSSVMGQ